MENTYWRKCGSCRKEIGYNTIYQVCSVSSCSKHVFCTVNCWDQHNPIMNHKAAWAEENRSPLKENASSESVEGVRRVIISPKSVSEEKKNTSENDQEILIVVSKLKQYIKDKFEMNTAASVMEVLSAEVRKITDRAAENARRDGRKTLMDRDFH